MDAYKHNDAIGIYLTGGTSNADPAESLGGAKSTVECMGTGFIIDAQVQGLIIEKASPNNGQGAANIVCADGSATYTPPGGAAGDAVAIAEGETKLLHGRDLSKSIRITREADKRFSGTCRFRLVNTINGVLSMQNADDDERTDGETRYRAVILEAHGDFSVERISAWIRTTGQATWELATEATVADEVQSIADDTTAPSGLSFTAAESEQTALSINNLLPDDNIGLWIKRIFPAAGTVAAEETVQLFLKYETA